MQCSIEIDPCNTGAIDYLKAECHWLCGRKTHSNRYYLQIEREANITIFIKGIEPCKRAHLHIFRQSSPLHLAHAAQATARSGSLDLQAHLRQCSVPGTCSLEAAPDAPYDEKLIQATSPKHHSPIIILSRQNAAKLPAGWSDWQLCSMYYGCRKSHMYSGCRESHMFSGCREKVWVRHCFCGDCEWLFCSG